MHGKKTKQKHLFFYYYSFTSSPASKLFDYEKESRPRSRRELVQSNISAETSRIPSPSGRLTGASSRTGHRGSLTPAISLTEGNTTTSAVKMVSKRHPEI